MKTPREQKIQEYLNSLAARMVGQDVEDSSEAILELSSILSDCENAILELSEIIGETKL